VNLELLLPFVVAGIVTGSVYGLAGMGLVLTYKTSGLFNFAHGTVGAVGAFAFYSLDQQLGLPWPVAALLTLGVVAPLLGLALERLAAGLAPARPAMKLVATVGLILLLVGLTQLLYGVVTRDFPPFLPTTPARVLGVNIGADQAITAALAAVVAVGLSVLLRRTATGRAMRAVVADPDLLSLTGVDPLRVRRTAWIIGCQLSVASGVLIATTLGLDALALTLLVVSAFGAAAIGRFSSLPWTFAGGLIVGVVESVLKDRTAGSTTLSGLPFSASFLVLLAVLVFSKRGTLVEAVSRTRPPSLPRPSRLNGVQAALVAGVGVGLLLAVPLFAGARLPSYTQTIAFVPIFFSLALLVWTSGQVSLAQAAFVAVGMASMSHLADGLPWLLALVLSGLVAVPFGLAVAIPAMRVTGLFLSLATFGFGVLMQNLVYGRSWMFGQFDQVEVPRPEAFSGDRAYYYVVLIAAAAVCVLVVLVLRSRPGRLLRALADSATALSTFGAEINRLRVAVFALAAFVAAVGGALLGGVTGSVSGAAYGPFTSLTWLAVLALMGARAGVVRALGAAAVLVLAPSFGDGGNPALYTLMFGAAAVAAALLSDREPRVGGGQRTRDRRETAAPLTEARKVEVPA
jgi:branched-subunit amino acid ABC-type transport system permease component